MIPSFALGISDAREPVYLPRPDYDPVCLDPSFASCLLAHSDVECLARGTEWGEGPVWFGDGRYLLWSDIPNDRILRWSEETRRTSLFRAPSRHANGNTRDRAGRLITCEHESRQVTRTEYDGTLTVLASRFDGKRLNSPNDVVVAPDGAIWFTDPDYGLLSAYEGGGTGSQELPTALYRLETDGGLQQVSTEFINPNGLCFSPAGDILYVIDSGSMPNAIWACELNAGRTRLTSRHLLIEPAPNARADGLRCDTDGNLWCGWGGASDLNGVMVFGPSGRARAHIPLPERCANLCFGGRRRNRLFMAASHGLYALYVTVQGHL
ncbi:gluconolactonase [Novacetimonas maltaceti]|uniref:Gluconolactonase n=1 Tax=Novacetimonas maltaceti TaxID=1203393 RepID=A0A2S3VYY1_9PROT|nr:SMP-30/gluconolactonase/LRE family protein [Novacetimonas maltaceti]POF61807.1 Gluconolactonase precursor [Novacetimonas maltaceti]PYD59029.1 gluconolactonase [Novacetimonas maltaceti]